MPYLVLHLWRETTGVLDLDQFYKFIQQASKVFPNFIKNLGFLSLVIIPCLYI